jgi:acyl-coenzyme A thioesterase PaaI-like protein
MNSAYAVTKMKSDPNESNEEILNSKSEDLSPPVFGEPFYTPGQNSEHHHGFVYCANNPHGLQVKFYRNKQGGIACLWENTATHFEGFPRLIHGGIIYAVLDDLMAFAVMESQGCYGLTLKSEVDFCGAIRIGEKIMGKSYVEKIERRFFTCRAFLFNDAHKCVGKSRGRFHLPTYALFQKLAHVDTLSEEIMNHFYRRSK